MSTLMKGNFTPAQAVESAPQQADSLEQRFEKEALKKLGGSIAFVAKKKVLWGDEVDNQDATE
ncbi:MAG: hypothetical protein HY941_02920 [Gammaproteobacteria bacterium]|nr:hypothetical protein [Gammaproteobacteria bacterium]